MHAKPAAPTAAPEMEMDPALAGCDWKQLETFFTAIGDSLAQPAPRNIGRWQDPFILEKIAPRSTVLDLGCGAGELLSHLIEHKQVTGQGIEWEAAPVLECVRRGVAVFQSDIYEGLRAFPDHSYDYVILEETLQTLKAPDKVLTEMLRVGRCGIVSFPNFAYWGVRRDFMYRGRMPKSNFLEHNWYDTPNIHHLSIQDFLVLAQEKHLRITAGLVLVNGIVRELRPADNLYAEEALFFVENSE